MIKNVSFQPWALWVFFSTSVLILRICSTLDGKWTKDKVPKPWFTKEIEEREYQLRRNTLRRTRITYRFYPYFVVIYAKNTEDIITI